MTQQIEKPIVGVDVAKHTLDVYVLATDQTDSIANEPESIESWLDHQRGPIRLTMLGALQSDVDALIDQGKATVRKFDLAL